LRVWGNNRFRFVRADADHQLLAAAMHVEVAAGDERQLHPST
jgi:hypothetical protein